MWPQPNQLQSLIIKIYVDQNKIRPDTSVSIIFPIPPSENYLDICQQVADY